MEKPGYFRIEGKYSALVSFEDLSSMSNEERQRLRDQEGRGELRFYCACNENERLQLHMTRDLYMRVAHNGQQDKHRDACPKSTVYEQRAREFLGGVEIEEGMDRDTGVYHLSLPPLYDYEQSSSGNGKPRGASPRDKKIAIDLFTRSLIRLAWQKQQYSIKKKIREALREQKKPQWEYKNLSEFLRLLFGNCNDVMVQIEREYSKFYDYCYKPSVFYKTANDYRFFICARIIEVKEYKAERKYQYVVLEMPSNRSHDKATVRIPTKQFDKHLRERLDETIEGTEKLLCGWVYHAYYPSPEGDSDWISFIRGAVIPVTSCGMYADTKEESALITELCKRHVLFIRPELPLLSYGGNIPTVLIEKRDGKDILIDIVKSTKAYEERLKYVENNPQYEIFLYKKKDDIDYRAILDAAWRRE